MIICPKSKAYSFFFILSPCTSFPPLYPPCCAEKGACTGKRRISNAPDQDGGIRHERGGWLNGMGKVIWVGRGNGPGEGEERRGVGRVG